MRNHRGKIIAVLVVVLAAVVAYFTLFNGSNATGTDKGTPHTSASPLPSNFPVIDNPPKITEKNVKELEQALNSPSASVQKLALSHRLRPSHNTPSDFGGTIALDAKTFVNDKVSGGIRGTVKTKQGTVHYAVFLVYEKNVQEPNGKWLIRDMIKGQQ